MISSRRRHHHHRHMTRTIHTICIFCVLLVILSHPSLGVNGAEECAAVLSYYCPACGGMTVSDCLDCDGNLNTDEEHKTCFSRKLFDTENPHYHYLWNDIGAAFVWFVAAGIATACGVGGGGIYVPLGMILLQLAPKVASGLSQASIFGASLGGLILNIRDQHPNMKIREDGATEDDISNGTAMNETEYLSTGAKYYRRPLIDYDMALFLAPMEMAGAVMGVIIQKLLPNWLYLMIAGIILFFTSYKTYKKFFATYKKEKEARAKAQQKLDIETLNQTGAVATVDPAINDDDDDDNIEMTEPSNDDDSGSNSSTSPPPTTTPPLTSSSCCSTSDQLTLRRLYLSEDARQYPPEKLSALIILWIGLFTITLLKGGKGVNSLIGITCSSSPWLYGILIASQFAWTLGFALRYGIRIVKKQTLRHACRYPILSHDVPWTFQKTQFYAGFTFVAGVVAGLIGIGGGMVLGPLMLIMGIHPRVSSATTATMIILTSSSVAVMFVTSGLVPWSYAAFYFSVCLCGAYAGKRVIDGYVKRTGMASVLIFILATIILLATVGCFYNMFSKLAASDWCLDGFKKFCYDSGDDMGCDLGRRLLGMDL